MKNSTGKRSAAAFKLKPTMAFAGQATAGAVLAFAATGSAFAQAATASEPAASMPMPAAAAASAPAEQQVVVTGIRRGIEAAISVKKNSDQIVEAISAEDIGKLPDTTIAESLARLPGVTTQRDKNGNATNISIRGLGPDFNGYLLNGREQTSTGDSRAVDLSVYPAELIAGATVYKTGDASLMTAGLAGTIDNRLIDPLAFQSRVLAVNAQKSETGRGLPVVGHGTRYGLSYIDQFADRKIGVAIGFVHSDGKQNQQNVSSWSGNVPATAADGTDLGSASLPFGGGMNFANERVTDKRNGLAGILEFKPNKNFSSELDIFWSKIDHYDKQDELEAQIGGAAITNATVANGQATSGTFQLGANPNGIIARSEGIFDKDKIESFGWKNSLTMSDDWRASVDLNHNSARRVERDIEAYGGIPTADTLSFTLPVGGQVPHLVVGTPTSYTDPKVIVIRDQTGWSAIPNLAQAGYSKGPTTTDKLDAGRLDFTHDLAPNGLFSDVQFGGNLSKRTKDRVTNEGVIVSETGTGADPIPYPAGSYVDHNVGGTGVDLLTFDPQAGLWAGAKITPKFNDDILSKTWSVEEKVSTAYAKLDIDSQMGSVPLRGNVGVQVVHTNQSSNGFRADVGSSPVLTDPTSGSQSNAGRSYNDILPSLNLVGDLGAGNILRFGAGIQIARPDMTQMRNSFALGAVVATCAPGQTAPIAGDTNCGTLTGSAGNPWLKPFKAKALDLSYEKYFANKGYLSGALFYKKLDTYITQQTTANYDFQAAAAAIGETAFPDPHVVSWLGTYTTPVNGNGGNIHGFELTASTPFSLVSSWLNGFGVTTSYSNTQSSVKIPNVLGLNPTQVVPATGTISMPGLSRINEKITLYYERGGFSAFIADNARSSYIGYVSNSTIGGYPTPIKIQGQAWVSAQIGYEAQEGWLKGLSVRLEGNNLNHPIYKELKGDGTVNTQNKTGASVDVRVSYRL